MALRVKYKINELDLDQIPGKNKTKRKKKRVLPGVKESNAGAGRSAGSGPKVKELRDVYDAKICALCLAPMLPVFPHSMSVPAVPVPKTIEAAAAAEKEALQVLLNIAAANAVNNTNTNSSAIQSAQMPTAETAKGGEIRDTTVTDGSGDPADNKDTAVDSSFSSSSSSLNGEHERSRVYALVNGHSGEEKSGVGEAAVDWPLMAAAMEASSYPASSITQHLPPIPPIQSLLSAPPAHPAHPAPPVARLPTAASVLPALPIPPVPSFFHRLVCTDCGINVHLGCHCETGGASVLATNAVKGTKYKIFTFFLISFYLKHSFVFIRFRLFA